MGDEIEKYKWVFLVGFIGGLLNVGNRKDKSVSRKFGDLLIGLISSMFFGWISFELILYFYEHERVALAGCGFFAWKGASWISEVVDKIIDEKILSHKESGDTYDI